MSDLFTLSFRVDFMGGWVLKGGCWRGGGLFRSFQDESCECIILLSLPYTRAICWADMQSRVPIRVSKMFPCPAKYWNIFDTRDEHLAKFCRTREHSAYTKYWHEWLSAHKTARVCGRLYWPASGQRLIYWKNINIILHTKFQIIILHTKFRFMFE
jgi:hypothetical protein